MSHSFLELQNWLKSSELEENKEEVQESCGKTWPGPPMELQLSQLAGLSV